MSGAGQPWRRRIVSEARAWLGTPYLHQGSCLGVGCDCLGLVRGVWRGLYGAEPEAPPAYGQDWAEARGDERLRDAALRHLRPVALGDIAPGDVLLFRFRASAPARHCGVMSADDLMVHAHDCAVASEVALTRAWRRCLAYAFAFPQPVDVDAGG